jgi:hypothetical protein
MSDQRSAAEKTEAELVRESIDANLPYLHSQRWAVEAGRLRGAIEKAPDTEKAAAQKALQDHYDTRDNPEASRDPLVRAALATIEARQRA